MHYQWGTFNRIIHFNVKDYECGLFYTQFTYTGTDLWVKAGIFDQLADQAKALHASQTTSRLNVRNNFFVNLGNYGSSRNLVDFALKGPLFFCQCRVMTEEELSGLRSHYGRLLSLPSPWVVCGVREEFEKGRVVIEVDWPARTALECPECGAESPLHDRGPEREWRHLGVMEFQAVVRARVPRCRCAEHGVKTVRTPWAEPGSRFTLKFEGHAVEVIQGCRSLNAALKLLDLHWSAAQRIMDRAVKRGLVRRSLDGVRHVGLDEKSFGKGQNYVSVMTDLDGHRVLEVEPGRDTASAAALWRSLPPEQRARVEAAAMDMGAGFAAGTRAEAPAAVIVHDRFHVSKMLNEAVDETRREEVRQLGAEGDESLTGTRFLWLRGDPVRGSRKEAFEELLERNLHTANAWAFKEQFAEFWHLPDAAAGLEWFDQWHEEVGQTNLKAVKKAAKALKKHLQGLLNYFLHRITNALTEGFNSRIQEIKSNARGFRSFANYRTRILFFCGKLDLKPQGT